MGLEGLVSSVEMNFFVRTFEYMTRVQNVLGLFPTWHHRLAPDQSDNGVPWLVQHVDIVTSDLQHEITDCPALPDRQMTCPSVLPRYQENSVFQS
jgi:hypothetical protein